MKGSGSICIAVLLAVSFCTVASAAERPVDVDNSTIRIHVTKAGLFSAAGHEHWVAAHIAQGSVDEAKPPHVAFTVSANKLTVEPDTSLSPDDQAKVQRTMQEKVLESARYPEISLRSTSVVKTGSDTWNVTGILVLHGRSNPVSATVHKTLAKYVGHCRIKQTDFGIQPVTVGGGLVKVKNELDIEFAISLAPPAAE
jgi:polyisoprenoid-binding protein YceI